MKKLPGFFAAGLIWILLTGLAWVAPPLAPPFTPRISTPSLQWHSRLKEKPVLPLAEFEKRWRTERLLQASA